jgi:hypothetical protein
MRAFGTAWHSTPGAGGATWRRRCPFEYREKRRRDVLAVVAGGTVAVADDQHAPKHAADGLSRPKLPTM